MKDLNSFLPCRGACQAFLVTSAALLPAAWADYQSEILSENPIAYYRFSDNVTSVDAPPSPAINSGTLGPAANGTYQLSFTRGVPGAIAGNTAVAFVDNLTPTSIDHTGSIVVPNNAALNPSHTGINPFTIECWVLPSRNTSTLLSPVNSMSFTTGRAGYLIYQNSGVWQWRMGNKASTTASFADAGVVTPGQWQHLAATYTGGANGTMTFYVDGAQVGSMSVANYEANDNGPFVIGATSAPNRTFDGSVDEVAFFNTELSASRIQARFNERTSNPAGYAAHVQADSPAGYWRLDEAPYVLRTPPVADNLGTLGNTADGSYSSQAQNSSNGPSPASGFGGFGENNFCLSLPNANAWVTSNQQLLNNRTSFTVMGWIKRGATHTTRAGYFGQNDLLEFGDAGNDTNVEAWINATGGNIVAPHNMVDDQWSFICLTGDGSTNRFFVNGTEIGTRNQVVPNYGTSAFNFNVGGGGIFNTAGDFFRGEIDEVAIFSHAVTPGRVQQLYAAALSNTGPGLVDSFPTVTPSSTVPEGESYTLSIDPTGSPPFEYQWKVDGEDIPGATGATYTVAAALVNDPVFAPRSYSVVVSNGSGDVSSEATDVYVSPVLRWTGNDATNPGDWDIGVSQNWKTLTAGTPATYSDAEFGVLFDDSAINKTVELTTDVTPVAVKFDNDTNYTVTGDQWTIGGISGSTFTKTGSGVLELANSTVYVEQIALNEGTLRVGNGTAGTLATVSQVTATAGTLQINQAAGSFYDSPTKLASGASLSVTGSGDLELKGTIIPAVGSTGSTETFNRNGTTVVSNTNSAGKTVAINAGRVAFDGNQNSNRLAANAAVSVNAGAVMEVRGVNSIPGGPQNSVDVTVNGGTLEVTSGGSAAIPGGDSHAHLRDLTLNGGQIILNYSGNGTAYNGESFQLNGDLTVGGSAASVISLGSAATAGNSGIALLAVDPGPPTAPAVHVFHVPDVVAGSAADLIIEAELEPTDAAAADTLASKINKTGTGTLRMQGVNHPYTGTLQVSEGTLEATGSIAGPLVINSGATIRPGTSVGAFTASATTLGGTYQCQIDGNAADLLQVNGNLTLQAGAQIAFSTLSGGVTASSYPIANCTGTISGPLPSVSGAPAGYTLSVVSNSSLVLAQAGASFGVTITPTPLPPGGVEDFGTAGGGFSVSTPVSPEADWTYNAASGSWRSNGQATQLGADNTSYMSSPVYAITQTGPITLTFSHRYSFEQDFYDGGAVEVSFNGGAFTRVDNASFSQNGYNGAVRADSGTTLQGADAFVENSTGHPSFITSICTLGNGTQGRTVQVRFISSSDPNTSGNLSPQGWEITSVQVSNAVPNLMTITWPVGTLQYSDNLLPPWTDMTASSPLVIDPESTPKRFYRLKP